jgi:hypothetical protein
LKTKKGKRGAAKAPEYLTKSFRALTPQYQKDKKGGKEKRKPVVVTRAAKAPEYLTKSFRAVTP